MPSLRPLFLVCILLPSWLAAEPRKSPEVQHWSLRPLISPPVPGAAANPIDAFILAKLTEKGLTPAPPADPRTLIRRISYDLTGLPPSPEEADAFSAACKDSEPSTLNANLSTLTDRLLASPRYGERWARHWFDTIHFADSHGYEHDIARENAWPFRDYVIAALNGDTLYPRFIREQLAADCFYPDEPQLIPALGFLGAGLFDMSAFATTVDMFDYIDRDDLVTQTMATFTSTTANCARCHAHKFDPISQEDYYSLQAVFAGLIKGEITYDKDPQVKRDRVRWNVLSRAADQKDAAVILAAENEPVVRAWLEQPERGVRWSPLKAGTFLSAGGATLTCGADDVITAGGPRPDKETYTITAPVDLPEITALRLDVLAQDALPMRGPGRNDNGNFHLSEIELQLFEPGQPSPRPVKISRATADFNQTDWEISKALDGNLKTAWGIHPAVGQSHQAVFEFAEKQVLARGTRLAVVLRQEHGGFHVIGALKLSVTSHPEPRSTVLPGEVEAALVIAADQRTPAQRLAIAAHAVKLAAETSLTKLPPQARVFAAAPSVDILSGDPVRSPKSLPGPKVVHVLDRGEFDKPKAVAVPGALSALKHLPGRFPLKDPQSEAERRAALADWIADPGNVLTWRSIVNRVWHYHFGRGLCDTPGDFGEMGGTPSHLELLDWMAVWFRDEAKGSLKQLHRLIVTSETYRRSSLSPPAGSINAADGGNRFLWRQNRHRLDADGFRDFTLAVSGRLDLTMGGPAMENFTKSKGPQNTPSLDYAAYDWSSPGSGRRSIYRFVWRGIADPLMEALDFPDLGLLSPVRSFSASPLQSLALYNNNFVLHHSEAFARRVEREAAALEGQVARAVRLVWLRDPAEEELREFTVHATRHGMASLCRLLLNSSEFLFVN